MPVYILADDAYFFPPAEFADEDGFLAIGGDLCAERLLNAYSRGIFPWYNPGEIIQWWCPKERFVILPKNIHISKSMKKVMKHTSLEVRFNTGFADVIRSCKMTREGQTWITDEMEAAFNNLFDIGHALSVGVYDGDTLVGGLYGVVIGECFFGESMFSKAANASKLALIHLCRRLHSEGFVFVDCQFHTEHLETMGGQYMSWKNYKRLLRIGTYYSEFKLPKSTK